MRRLTSPEDSSSPSKRRRTLQRRTLVRSPSAQLSALHKSPVNSLQSSRSRPRGNSTSELLGSDPFLYKAVSSTSKAIPDTPPAFVLPGASIPRPQPAFLDLPVESRNQIYVEFLGPPTTIHVIQPRNVPQDYFLFLLCSTPEGPTTYCPQCFNLKPEALQSDHDVYDMSLLLVSQQVREEASRIIFSRNQFWFPSWWVASKLSRAFPSDLKSMRSMSFPDVYDENTSALMIGSLQQRGRWMREYFPALNSLTIFLQIRSNADWPIFEEGVLNYFRPLSKLNLSEAHVTIDMLYGSKLNLTEEQLSALSSKAESILLLDPSLPEQEMHRPLANLIPN